MKNLIYSNWWIIIAIVAMGLIMVMGLNKPADAADLPSCYLYSKEQDVFKCLKKNHVPLPRPAPSIYSCFGDNWYKAMRMGVTCSNTQCSEMDRKAKLCQVWDPVDDDPWYCFGAGRYDAMSEGKTCN